LLLNKKQKTKTKNKKQIIIIIKNTQYEKEKKRKKCSFLSKNLRLWLMVKKGRKVVKSMKVSK
jgi:hypothetical protein